MLKNYFNSAFRNLIKYKSTALINLLGLGLGITCALVILIVVRYETSFDHFHSHADRIYRVVRTSAGANKEYRAGVSYPLTEALRNELASVQKVAAAQYIGEVQVGVYDEKGGKIENRFQEKSGFVLVEPSFFDIFDFNETEFHWIAGHPATALSEPFTVVLTQSMAEKFFPGENPVGKILRIRNQDDFKVTGVISDLPSNTDFPFLLIGSYATMKAYVGETMNNWYGVSDDNQCYILLNEGVTQQEAEAQITNIHAAHVDEALAKDRLYPLQPLDEIHSDARFGNYKGRTVSQEIIWALVLIGFFLLLTACINFINLSTAQAVIRSKEVGIRKVMGSKRGQLIIQFLGETFLLTFLASVLTLGVAELIILNGRELLQVQLNNFLSTDPFVLLSLVLIVIMVTLAAGFYPALIQSGFHPIAALKNKMTGNAKQSVHLRSGLVVLQFVISQVFIIGTLVIIQQMDYFKNADLGFDQQAIVTVNVPENQQDLQSLFNQWEQMSAVEQVSFSSTHPSGLGRNTSHTDIRRINASTEESIVFEYQSVDEHYFNLYHIPLVAGRNFISSDTAQNIILNETLMNKAGFKQASEAIGEEMMLGDQAFTIVGVVKDFHANSLKEGIGEVAFVMNPRRYVTASIKLSIAPSNPGAFSDLQETIASIEKSWTTTFPEYVFDYQFLDESIAAYYREEKRLSKLFKILAGITIFIGCLGLFGLVTFMAVRRTKEVGVRKVLGASVSHILLLFSKEFVYLILIAFCIAGPVAWYIMQLWLQNFTYQVDIEISVFLLAMFASLLIAILTVSYQSFKAAIANPVDSLRNE